MIFSFSVGYDIHQVTLIKGHQREKSWGGNGTGSDNSAEFYEAAWTLTTKKQKDIYGKGNYNRNYHNTSWGDPLE